MDGLKGRALCSIKWRGGGRLTKVFSQNEDFFLPSKLRIRREKIPPRGHSYIDLKHKML